MHEQNKGKITMITTIVIVVALENIKEFRLITKTIVNKIIPSSTLSVSISYGLIQTWMMTIMVQTVCK